MIDHPAFMYSYVLAGIARQQGWKLRLESLHLRLQLFPFQPVQIAR